MEKPNISLIGIGEWGKKLAQELKNQTNLSYLVHTGSPETAAWISNHFAEVRSTNNLDQVLSDPEIEAVAIATPIPTHIEITRKALEAKKNVFLEKPGGENSEEIGKLIDEANKKGLILQVGYEFAHSPKLQEIKDQIAGEPIDKISFIWRKWGSFKAHPVINLLVHELSILKTLGVNNIEITKYEEVKGDNDPDSIHVEAKAGKTIISFDINRVSKEKEHRFDIQTRDNKYVWKDEGENLIGKEIEAFVDSVKNKRRPITDGKFAKEILETIETIPYQNHS